MKENHFVNAMRRCCITISPVDYYLTSIVLQIGILESTLHVRKICCSKEIFHA